MELAMKLKENKDKDVGEDGPDMEEAGPGFGQDLGRCLVTTLPCYHRLHTRHCESA